MKKLYYLIAFLFGIVSIGQAQKGELVEAEKFSQIIQNKSNAELIDLRTPEEFTASHLVGSKNINYYENFDAQLEKLDKNKTYYIYCKSGGRSGMANEIMTSKGFKVIELKGGILKWESENRPIEKGNASDKKSIPLDKVAFEKLVGSYPIVIVDFHAKWCAPCKVMAPEIEALEKKMNGAFKLIKIDIDEHKALSRELKIENIPYLVVYKDGKQVSTFEGYTKSVEFEKLVNELSK